ncbi:hypothetical protein ACIRD6_15010 [Streptomyces sp. NPDC102473]|uniref:hypothetical protein n=1 Tax=Streptomyces sp. NPDC102473 TaxID=3366180 RepID=UPI00382190B1
MESTGGDVTKQHTDSNTDSDASAEFVYRLTTEDFEEALRARARRTPAGRAQALMAPLVAAAAVTVLPVSGGTSLPVWAVSLVLAVGVACWGTVRGFRTMARRMYSVMGPYGECRTVADDRGAVSTGERASFTTDWAVHKEYLETPGLFVLLSGDRSAGIAVVPKRGARTSADVDRLRVILDRNLRRR